MKRRSVLPLPLLATAVLLAVTAGAARAEGGPPAGADSLAARADRAALARPDSAALARGDSLARGPAPADSSAVPPAVVPAVVAGPAPSPATPAAVPTLSGVGATAAGSRRMQDSVTVLPTVRVEGARVDQPARSTNTQVRLQRGALVRFLPSTPAEAMLAAPGVDIVRTGGWASQVALRGLTGERVLVMVDGVRLNTGRGHGAQSSLVSTDRLDAVELTPGAGGAAYGSDALAGVVNLVTHRPLFTSRPSLAVSWNVRGSEPGDEGAVGGRLALRTGSFGAEVAGGLSRVGAFVTPGGPLDNSGDREDDLSGRVAARTNAVTIDYEHAHHAAHDVGLPAFDGGGGATASYPLQARDADRLELGGPVEPGRVSWHVLASSQRYRSDFDEITVDSSFVRNRFVATTTTGAADRVTTYSRGVVPELRLLPNGALRLGGEYRRETTSGPRQTDVTVRTAAGVPTSETSDTGESVPPAWRDVASAWLSTGVEHWRTRVEGGLRFDRVRSHADSTAQSFTSELDVADQHWSADGGISHRFGVFEPYVHVANGFRVANLDERYFNDEVHAGMRIFGNPALRPEVSSNVEGGLRADGDRGSLQLSVYRSNVTDLISLRYLGQLYLVPRFQYDNIAKARLEGIEMTGRTHVRSVALTAQATLPRGTDLATGDPLPDIGASRVTGELAFGLPRFVPQGRAAIRVRWFDAVKVTDRGAAEGEDVLLARPAATTVAVEGGATVVGLRVTLAVRNLFNLGYREPMSFIDEAGRTVAFSIRRDFETPLATHRSEGRP
ncbi:MAG TPA: TonB-dependent receptor [Dongiaceae bacterium]|nr:TonB-dependent receptor [Dongiaceae bacterium]